MSHQGNNNTAELAMSGTIRILFVVQDPWIWSSLRSVWHASVKNSHFTVKVVLSPFFHHLSSTVITLINMKQRLIDDGVSFCTIDFLNLEQYRPHVVFLQNPYDTTRPEFLRSVQLVKAGAKIAYVPYGLEMGGGVWNLKNQFDSELHRLAWRIFSRSERHKKMFAKYCSAGDSHVVVTGHPKFDLINIDSNSFLSEEITKKIDGRKVILWTPHFSVFGSFIWSTWQLYSEYILTEFTQRQGLFLLIRPHPILFKTLHQSGIWDADAEKYFRKTIKNSLNIGLDENPDCHAAFAVSNALMADVGSFLLQYLPYGKPLLYLHLQNGLGMNDDGELVNSLYVAASNEDIKHFIDMISDGLDTRKSERELATSEFLSNLDQNIGEKICQHIYSSITAGDTWSPKFSPSAMAQQQSASNLYWINAVTTYLAPPEYYKKKEVILEEVLTRLPAFRNIIDLGCGDGKFTMQLAKHAQIVMAYDISEVLINRAKSNAIALCTTNINFYHGEFEHITPFEKFHLVSAMGVTSCIIDDSKFLFFINKLKAFAQEDAFIFMIDTLSTVTDQMATDQNGYIAKYRSIDDYRSVLLRAGFIIQDEILIKEIVESNSINKLFIMRLCG